MNAIASPPNAESATELSLDEAVRYAIGLQRSRQLDAAETLYRRVLQSAPEHPDALHYLGLLAFQRGRADEAVALLERAAVRPPDYPDFHSNLNRASLVRQSFPTLILLSFDNEQLKPRLQCKPDDLKAPPEVLEPRLHIDQTRRWVPRTEKAAANGSSDGAIAALNDEVTRAYKAPAACEPKDCIAKNVRDQISACGNALAEELLGNFSTQYLPLCMVVPDLPDCNKAPTRQAAAQGGAARPKSPGTK